MWILSLFTCVTDESDDLSESIKILESQVKNINRLITDIEETIETMQAEHNEEIRELQNRISTIEDQLDMDEREIVESIRPDACELEKLSAISEESREKQYNVRVNRAIKLYENFNELSTSVAGGGQRVLSKDIKKFLNGASENRITYVQVQRVIDTFIEKTGDDFYDVQTDDGRAIVWTA